MIQYLFKHHHHFLNWHNIWNINKKYESIRTKFWQEYEICLRWSIDHDRHTNWSCNGFEKIYKYFLTSVYCMTYKTNLTAIDATKVRPYKNMSREINVLLNSLALHFKKLYKKNTLLSLQDELVDSTKCLKKYHKIRWLSRWQVVIILSNFL